MLRVFHFGKFFSKVYIFEEFEHFYVANGSFWGQKAQFGCSKSMVNGPIWKIAKIIEEMFYVFAYSSALRHLSFARPVANES